MRYRKKPIEIDAVHYSGSPESRRAVLEFTGVNAPNAGTIYWRALPVGGEIVIRTPEGDLIASEGDWIIRGIKGEVYPCKPDIFAATYDPA